MRIKTYQVSLLFFLTMNLQAYQFTEDFNLGVYWSRLPITVVKVAANAAEGDQLDSVLLQAEQEWESVVGVEIWDNSQDHYIGSAPSGNVIRWSDNFGADTGFSPDTTLAVTIRYRIGTFFDRFEIVLNGENESLRSNSGGILYQTMIHELGHVLGIGHAERAPAVMEASLQGYNSLQEDDQDAISAIYDETIFRQDTGFVSALAQEQSDSTNALSCATISLSQGPPGGPKSGPLTLFAGILMTLITLKLINGKEVPIYI
jgi:hypothetical protein